MGLGDLVCVTKAGILRRCWANAQLAGRLAEGIEKRLALSTHSQLAQSPIDDDIQRMFLALTSSEFGLRGSEAD